MSQRLSPCHGCSRHVRVEERSCPFCGIALAEPSLPRLRGATRVGRAASFVLGLTMAAAACDDDDPAGKAPRADAATRDAATRDASTRDAELDASSQDARVSDARVDASATDARVGDAKVDAAPEDANVEPADAGDEWDGDIGIPIYAAAPTPDDGTRLVFTDTPPKRRRG